MDKKYQIFVSSTYVDLIEERQQVMRAILEMGHIPVGMEQFSAADEEQWKIIQRQIDQSDYYVVLIAHRYGSTIPGSGISYTEKEYNYAVEQGIPTLGFVIDTSVKDWPHERFEDDSKKKKSLDKFKTKVKQKPVQFWKSSSELHGMVAIALGKSFNTQPRPGWVRSDSGIGPEVAEEIARLSKENKSLKEALPSTPLEKLEQEIIIEIHYSEETYQGMTEYYNIEYKTDIKLISFILNKSINQNKNFKDLISLIFLHILNHNNERIYEASVNNIDKILYKIIPILQKNLFLNIDEEQNLIFTDKGNHYFNSLSPIISMTYDIPNINKL